VFENKVLKRILRKKMDEMTGALRKILNVKLHKLHSSPYIYLNIIMKSRTRSWVTHAARMGGEECIYDFAGKAGWKEITRKA
jgi:hypothetical protein